MKVYFAICKCYNGSSLLALNILPFFLKYLVTTHIENVTFFPLTKKIYKVLIECLSKSYQPMQFNLFNYAKLSLLSETDIKSTYKN